MHLPAWKRLEVQNLAVLKFNNYARLWIDNFMNIIFADRRPCSPILSVMATSI